MRAATQALGQEPKLAPAPPEVHAGVEATGPSGSGIAGRFTRMAAEVTDKVTPG